MDENFRRIGDLNTRAFTIKRFTNVNISVASQARVFVNVSHLRPSLIFTGKARA
jgi:hypothetical protein